MPLTYIFLDIIGLMRGVREGATSFMKSVTWETMHVTARLAQGAQGVLEAVHKKVAIGPSSSSSTSWSSRTRRRMYFCLFALSPN
jgi:hypothetical protein